MQNAMDANDANQDQMNETLQREQNLLDRVGALELQIDDIQEENRMKLAEKVKETDRLLLALKESEQKAREAIFRTFKDYIIFLLPYNIKIDSWSINRWASLMTNFGLYLISSHLLLFLKSN